MGDDYKYRLVEFKSKKNNIKSVDIVPKEWITWDTQKKEFLCYFMPPPYNKGKLNENFEILLKHVNNQIVHGQNILCNHVEKQVSFIL